VSDEGDGAMVVDKGGAVIGVVGIIGYLVCMTW
jgi:hypothetical protein